MAKLLACEITDEQEKTVEELCKKENRSKSNLVKNLLRLESEKQGLKW